jgi:hypothetical protein
MPILGEPEIGGRLFFETVAALCLFVPKATAYPAITHCRRFMNDRFSTELL